MLRMFSASSETMAHARSSNERLQGLAPSTVVGLVYLLWALWVLRSTGHLSHWGTAEYLFSEFDSTGYRILGDYIWSIGATSAPRPSLVALRPLGYPFVLGSYRWIGVFAFQSLQMASMAASVGALHFVLAKIVGRVGALVAVTALAFLPGLVFMAPLAMTETPAFVVSVAWLHGLWRFCDDRSRTTLLVLASSVLVVLRPAFQPLLLLVLLTAGVSIARKRSCLSRTALGLSPLLVQLVLTASWTGRPTLAESGSSNFNSRFYPAVYAQQERGDWRRGIYKTKFAAYARQKNPTLSQQVGYLRSHPKATWDAYKTILIDEHLRATSAAISGSKIPANAKHQHRARGAWRARTGEWNRNFAWAHAFALPLLALGLVALRLRSRTIFAGLASLAAAATLVVSAPLVYFQGERVVAAAVPFWLFGYAALVAECTRAVVKRLREVRSAPKEHGTGLRLRAAALARGARLKCLPLKTRARRLR